LVLIIGTPVPKIPLTEVVSVLTELELLTEFTIGAVAATPLTVLVRVLVLLPNVLVVALNIAGAKFNAPEATPFMVEVTEVPERESALELITGTPIPVIPFTVVESILTELLLLIEFTMGEVAVIPFTVLVRVLVALPIVWVVEPVTNGIQFGEAGVPTLTINKLVVVLNINKPVAGEAMAFCWVVVIRGVRKPLEVLLTSSIALTSGRLPVAFTDTFCACIFDTNASWIIRNANRAYSFIKLFGF
jgi:hypothetical protein